MSDLADIALELLDDPDFVRDFTGVRVAETLETVGLQAGELIATPSAPITMAGVIYPNRSPAALSVLPEGLRTSAAIHVFTRSQLLLGDPTEASGGPVDYVQFLNNPWKVVFLQDWSDFGFYHASAVLSPRSEGV